jgi:hypothetical protein
MPMRLVLVDPGDKDLYGVACPHCHREFGKGDKAELVYESWDQSTALHKACVDALMELPEPAEVQRRYRRAQRALAADVRALAVESRGGRRRGTPAV